MRIYFKKVLTLMMVLLLLSSASGCSSSIKVSTDVPSSIPPLASDSPDEPAPPDNKRLSHLPKPVQIVEYTGPKYHVFFHSLIAFPDIAYSKSAGAGAFDTDCITVSEFKKTLEELYKNNFMLTDIHSYFDTVDENGTKVTKEKKLMFPEGKKPLIMSVDDMVYDPKKMGLGMVDKIILDSNGDFATYTKMKDGKEIISHDNEIIPILEQFVKTHPDFSFNGAKAALAVTGWVGILGYRIDRLEPNKESEIEAVKPIVQKLKDNGWSFVSHSYGHRHEKQISYNLFADDTEKWHKEIEPIVGATDVYVYPYGEKLSVDDPKYKLLLQYGFKLICGVGSDQAFENYGNSIFMDRQAIDGYSLRNYKKSLSTLIDATKVLNTEERTLH